MTPISFFGALRTLGPTVHLDSVDDTAGAFFLGSPTSPSGLGVNLVCDGVGALGKEVLVVLDEFLCYCHDDWPDPFCHIALGIGDE